MSEKLDAYDAFVQESAVYPRTHRGNFEVIPVYPTIGLCEEAGEFAGKVKKAWRNNTPLDRQALLKELGDVLWYMSAAAYELGSSLCEVLELNMLKVADRRARNVVCSEGDNR